MKGKRRRTGAAAAAPASCPFRLSDKSSSLNLRELSPGLFAASEFLSPAECDDIIRAVTPHLTPTNPSNAKPAKGYAFRNNDRANFEDAGLALALFTRLEPVLSQLRRPQDDAAPLELNDNIRLYKYSQGQRFGPHVDEPVVVTSKGRQLVAEFTLLVYLSGGRKDPQTPPLQGGATRFYVADEETVDVQPEVGRICLHWTGHDFMHEGAAVTSGDKYVLRTDVLFPT